MRRWCRLRMRFVLFCFVCDGVIILISFLISKPLPPFFFQKEIERLKNEHTKQVADMKAEMERMMQEMKAQADEALAKMLEEKEDSIIRVEVMAEVRDLIYLVIDDLLLLFFV